MNGTCKYIRNIVLVSLFFGISSPAYTFSLFNCFGTGINPSWTNPNQTWRLDTNSFVEAGLAPMETAAGRIRAIRGSNINPFTQRVAFTNSVNILSNGTNDAVIDILGIYIGSNSTAAARVLIGAVGSCANLTSAGNFTEVDVAYSVNFNWTATPDSITNTNQYTGSIFAHELGHAVGVAHEDTGVLAVMNAAGGRVLGGPNGNEQGTPAFHGQDVAAVRQIYPDSTTGTNAYVSKWKRGLGPFNTTNNQVQPRANLLRTANGSRVNSGSRIFSGSGYRLEYTAGNTGTSARNITVDMRISSPNNQNIHFGNQIIATRTHFLQPGQNVESQINFTMPNVLSNQNYYFGYTVRPPGDNDAADNRTIIRGRFRG